MKHEDKSRQSEQLEGEEGVCRASELQANRQSTIVRISSVNNGGVLALTTSSDYENVVDGQTSQKQQAVMSLDEIYHSMKDTKIYTLSRTALI
eukprot:scaffold1160_cov174-Ochromonas_danica.AAC.30